MCANALDEISTNYWVTVGITKNLPDGKYYIYIGADVNSVGNYLIGYYILKDI